MQTVVNIGIPKKEQNEILCQLIDSTKKTPTTGLKIQSLFGVPIKTTKKLSITIEI